jgi:hypothetical protein
MWPLCRKGKSLILVLLLLFVLLGWSATSWGYAASVVGNGTPASCDNSALATALATGWMPAWSISG